MFKDDGTVYLAKRKCGRIAVIKQMLDKVQHFQYLFLNNFA